VESLNLMRACEHEWTRGYFSVTGWYKIKSACNWT
jgi:hypothetical protein